MTGEPVAATGIIILGSVGTSSGPVEAEFSSYRQNWETETGKIGCVTVFAKIFSCVRHRSSFQLDFLQTCSY